MQKGYILVWTNFAAFEIERILKNKANMTIKLVPTPREFSSDCGIAVYFELEDNPPQSLESMLDTCNLSYKIEYLG